MKKLTRSKNLAGILFLSSFPSTKNQVVGSVQSVNVIRDVTYALVSQFLKPLNTG